MGHLFSVWGHETGFPVAQHGLCQLRLFPSINKNKNMNDEQEHELCTMIHQDDILNMKWVMVLHPFTALVSIYNGHGMFLL